MIQDCFVLIVNVERGRCSHPMDRLFWIVDQGTQITSNNMCMPDNLHGADCIIYYVYFLGFERYVM